MLQPRAESEAALATGSGSDQPCGRLAGSTGWRIHWEDVMTREMRRDPESMISRRTLVHGLAIATGAAAVGTGGALAQQGGELGPPTTITSPPRDFGPGGAPTTFCWDPDIIAVDPSFNDIAQPNTAIKRLYTGLLWAEGPAWSAQGRYLLWSDIPNNRQMRWSEDDGHVSVFRFPSNNSNGNSFDFQGRQLSCEHLTRRVVRYEHDGTVSMLADNFNGKKAQFAQRCRRPPGWQLLVHRPAVWRSRFERRARPSERRQQCCRQAQSADRPAGRLRAGQPRAPDQLLSDRSQRPPRPRGDRGPGAGSQRAGVLAGLQEAVRRQYR